MATLTAKTAFAGQAVRASKPCRRAPRRYHIIAIRASQLLHWPGSCVPTPMTLRGWRSQRGTVARILARRRPEWRLCGLRRAAGKAFAAYDKESQFFDLNDLENTIGSWDM
jgi:hypothetical protein